MKKRKENSQKLADEYEFDHENILKIDFPHLEKAIKYLLREMGLLCTNVDKMQKDIKSRAYIVDKMHKEGTERDDKVKELQSKTKDLENKSIDLENKQFEFNSNYESFKMNVQIQNMSINSMKERIVELEDFHESEEPRIKVLEEKVSGSPVGHNPHHHNHNSEFITIPEFESLTKRVDNNDKLVDEFISRVKQIKDKLHNDHSSHKKTPNFADSDQVEHRIRNLEHKVENLKNMSIGHEMGDYKASAGIEFEIENRVKSIEKDIEDIKSSVPVNTVGSNDGTTHSSISYNLKKRVDGMIKEQQELKSAVISCQQLITNKVDFEQLQEIDKVVTDKLNDCIKAVKRQMHDKSESFKNLKRLEKQLRSLYDVLYSQVGASEEDDDPLVGKRAMTAYNASPYDKSKTYKYPVWGQLPPKKSYKRSKNPKAMNRMVGNPKGDPRALKYYNMGPSSLHNTQPEFYDAQESNMIRQYQQPMQHFYQSGSDNER